MGRRRTGPWWTTMRAATRAVWRDSPDQRLFHATLYERHDLRRAKSGPLDKRRPLTHSEGVRVVKPMLPDIPDTDPLDVEWEADTVAKMLAGQGPFSNILPCRRVWRKYIKGAQSIRVFFDALHYIYEEMRNRGRAIPRLLARWREDVAVGRRRRPAMSPKPNHRPANWTRLVRDIHIQFTHRGPEQGWRAAQGTGTERLRLPHRGRCAGGSRTHGGGRLEKVRLEKTLRAHDAEIREGHRHAPRALQDSMPWALQDSLRREPPLGSRLDLPLSGRGRPAHLPSV